MKILIILPNLYLGGTYSCLKAILQSLDIGLFRQSIHICPLSSTGFSGSSFEGYDIVKAPNSLNYYFTAFYRLSTKEKLKAAPIKVLKKMASVLKINFEDYLLKKATRFTAFSGYDIVIGFEEGMPTKLAAYVKAKKKIAWVHSNLAYSNYNPEDFNSIYRQFDEIICVSKTTLGSFNGLYPDCHNKTRTIYNFIDTERCLKMSTEEDEDVKLLSSSSYSIVSVGRLDSIKQFHLIPRIAFEICKSGVKFRWFIVGEGLPAYRTLIEEEIHKYGVEDKVILLGYKKNPYPLIAAADLFVSTSLSEACPMVFLEANTLGTFIVSNNFLSAKEFLKDGVGVICGMDDMADRIISLIQQRPKPSEKIDFSDISVKSINSLLENV